MSRFFCLIFLLLPAIALGGEVGYAAKDIEIRSEPNIKAPVIGKLPQNGRFELLQRRMAWAQISVQGQTQGWVLYFFLANGDAPKSQAPMDGVGDALGFVRSRQGTGSITASVGIRGISEEQLKSAKFNEAELNKMRSFTTTAPAAVNFARDGQLRSLNLNYLPDPVPEGGTPFSTPGS